MKMKAKSELNAPLKTQYLEPNGANKCDGTGLYSLHKCEACTGNFVHLYSDTDTHTHQTHTKHTHTHRVRECEIYRDRA